MVIFYLERKRNTTKLIYSLRVQYEVNYNFKLKKVETDFLI
jgi:hypothetical protein